MMLSTNLLVVTSINRFASNLCLPTATGVCINGERVDTYFVKWNMNEIMFLISIHTRSSNVKLIANIFYEDTSSWIDSGVLPSA